MVGIKDVIKAINLLLKTNFPDTKPSSKDIKENIIRPSFYVDLEDYNPLQINSLSRQDTSTIRIYYFPKDRNNNRIELLDVEQKLGDLFLKGFWVNEDFYIHLLDENSKEFIVVDGVLQLRLELNYLQLIEDDNTYEMLEELETNINQGGN